MGFWERWTASKVVAVTVQEVGKALPEVKERIDFAGKVIKVTAREVGKADWGKNYKFLIIGGAAKQNLQYFTSKYLHL